MRGAFLERCRTATAVAEWAYDKSVPDDVRAVLVRGHWTQLLQTGAVASAGGAILGDSRGGKATLLRLGGSPNYLKR